MGIIPKREYKKPKLKKGDLVIQLETTPQGGQLPGRLTTVETVTGNKVRVKGETTDYSESGSAPGKRAVLVNERLRAALNSSPFLRPSDRAGAIRINEEMLLAIDHENEKLA